MTDNILKHFGAQVKDMGHSRMLTYLEKVNYVNGSHMMVVKTIDLWHVGEMIHSHKFVKISHFLPIFEKVETEML